MVKKIWEVVRVRWGEQFKYLAEGFEPFGVGEKYDPDIKETISYLYLRKLQEANLSKEQNELACAICGGKDICQGAAMTDVNLCVSAHTYAERAIKAGYSKPTVPADIEARVTELADNILTEDAVVFLNGDRSRLPELKNWNDVQVELHYQLRNKAIDAIKSLIRPKLELALLESNPYSCAYWEQWNAYIQGKTDQLAHDQLLAGGK